MAPWQGDARLHAGFSVMAGFGLATGLLEGPWSILTTGAPFAFLEWLRAHGHHAAMFGVIAAHNMGVAATLPALGRVLESTSTSSARPLRAVRTLFAMGLLALGATAASVPPTREALPIFVLEGLAVLALAAPAYRKLASGRGVLAPWCGLAALLVLAAAALEVQVV